MSTEMARVLAALAIGGIVSGQVYINTRQGTRQYGVFYSRGGGILPAIVVMVLLVSLFYGVGGSWDGALEMFSWIVEIFVLISVYFVLLTLALPLLRRYRELGGKLVTLGSDAHRTEDLGKGIDEGMELLKEAGFGEFALYVKRQPVLLPLE